MSMKKVLLGLCNSFLALAVVVGQIDVSMISREDFHQPPVPEQLRK